TFHSSLITAAQPHHFTFHILLFTYYCGAAAPFHFSHFTFHLLLRRSRTISLFTFYFSLITAAQPQTFHFSHFTVHF
ncbi:MAG: hypothetical protein IK118_07065, partial [Clostridia bacterium]|nr:hypothetical protein [Clostridia bacterium]